MAERPATADIADPADEPVAAPRDDTATARREPTSYDEVPYLGHAYWFTHPDHLSVMGGLQGLDTAPSDTCRFLEIGCGDGGNILSLASLLPHARFVGVDLSSVHIAMGQANAAALGLRNVTLIQGDLSQLELTPGSFDYVVAHGLYSWIPLPIREALLAVMARALQPNGVALVSYNALPGQWPYEPLRQLMRFHTARVADPAAKVRQGWSIANMWVDHQLQSEPDGRGQSARFLGNIVMHASPDLVRHDYLSESESAVYFSDFIAQAERHGLSYLDNAASSSQRPEMLDPEAAEMLMAIKDPVRRQQYFDFFESTRFRVTLLARSDAPRAAALPFSALALEARLEMPLRYVHEVPRVAIETATGRVEIEDLPTRVVIGVLLSERPRAVPVQELVDTVFPRLVEADPDNEQLAGEAGRAALLAHVETKLLELWRHGGLHFWRTPPPCAPRRGNPRTGNLQRLFARDRNDLPNLYHRHVPLSEQERLMLLALDGSLDVPALVARFGPETDDCLESLREKRLLYN